MLQKCIQQAHMSDYKNFVDDNLCQLMQKSKHGISIIILNFLLEISWENKKSTGYLNNKQSKSKESYSNRATNG